MREELKFVVMEYGGQSMMEEVGTIMMPLLFVDNLDT